MSDPNRPPATAADAELEALHQEAQDALTRVGTLLDAAYAAGITYGTGADQEQNRRELRNNAESVRGLELIMPIVAPMKAGKSTLINAIVGHPLLPARVNPMTTLPTRIKLVDDLDPDRPRLLIPRRTLGLFERIGDRIADLVARSDWTVPDQQSHLRPLARAIADGTAEPLREEYEGTGQVQTVLTRLNDQLRLAVLAGVGDLLSDLRDLPELRTGHWGGWTGGGSGGELVLVDTPGPNEYALSSHLGAVLDDILRAGHVVLVVIDYTQMGADAAETIGNLLRAQVEVIGSDKVIAVVNKVDARGDEADLNEADTRTAVGVGLGLSAARAGSRIFEVQARMSLIGAQMLAELDRYGDAFVPSDSDAARVLMKQAEKMEKWEDIRYEITAGKLRRLAGLMVKQGGMRELVAQAITRLRADAAPMLIDSGVRRHLDALVKLGDVLRLERGAADLGRAAVAAELSTLDGELRELQDLRDAMPDVADIERRFTEELDGFTARLREQGDSVIALLKDPREAEPPAQAPARGADFLPSLLRRGRKALWNGVLGGKQDTDIQEFGTEADAKDFTHRMSDSVIDQLTELLDFARRELDTRVRAITATTMAEQETKVRDLIDRSTANLSTAFSVSLDVPPPVVVDGAITVDLPQPKVRTSGHTSTYTTVEPKRFLYVFHRNVEVRHSSTSYSDHYQVSRAQVAAELREGFEARLTEIADGLGGYVTDTVHDRLASYYERLEGFLQGFRDALARSLDNSRRGEAEQARRKDELERLADRAGEERAALTLFLDRLGDYRDRRDGGTA